MKYYFITYQAKTQGDVTIWNACINVSPMSFILDVAEEEKHSEHGPRYHDFVVLSALEISAEEYEEFAGEF